MESSVNLLNCFRGINFYNIFCHSKSKQTEENEIIASLSSPSMPLDYLTCMKIIQNCRSYLKHPNSLIRTLAAAKIISLVFWALVLADFFFCFSKSALKGVAKELLGIVSEIDELQEKGQISLSGSSLSEFDQVVKTLVKTIYDDPKEAKKPLSGLLKRNKNRDGLRIQANRDKFVSAKN